MQPPSSQPASLRKLILAGFVVIVTVASAVLSPTGPVHILGTSSALLPSPSAGNPIAGPSDYRLSSVALGSVGPDYLQATPSWLAYDHTARSFYVAVPPSSVDIVPGNFTTNPVVSAVIPVGADPFGVAYDNTSGEIFVTNTGSNNVSVLQGNLSTPIASITVGTEPMGVAYNPVNGNIYVANNGSNDVSVISGSTLALLGTIHVGTQPLGVAVDPDSGAVFVANHGSANVSVISSASLHVVANVGTGDGPFGVAVDNASDNVYVTNEGSSNITVISAVTDALITSISVSDPGFAVDLQGIAYDSGSNRLWVGAGRLVVAWIDPNSEDVGVDNFDPSGVAYDPDTGDICVTNTANATLECAQWTTVQSGQLPLTFYETGLPAGQSWTVTLNSGSISGTSSSNSLTFNLSAAAGQEFTYAVSPSGSYFPEPSTGTVSVYPSGTVVNVSFSARVGIYPITLTESGLPSGSVWSVFLGSSANTTFASLVTFAEPDGTYAFSVYGPPRYSPAPFSGTVTVAGGPETEAIVFSPESFVATFQAAGLPTGANWSVSAVNVSTGFTVAGTSSGANLTLHLPNGTFNLIAGGPPGYSVTLSRGLLTVTGAGATSLTVTFLSSTTSSTSTPEWVFALVGVGVAMLVVGAIALVFGVSASRKRPPPG